ncbi:hypothetical protein D3C75_1372160 [compost metagenome]
MEQEHFARLHFMGLAQQIMYRQPFQKRGGTLLKAQVVRQDRHFLYRNIVNVAVGAE